MKPITIFVAVVMAIILCSTVAYAAFCDKYYTDPNPVEPYSPEPVDPTDPGAGWFWPDPPYHGPIQYCWEWPEFYLGPGDWMIFAHENWYIEEFIKTVYLQFNFEGGQPSLLNWDWDWGYHPMHDPGSSESWVCGEKIIDDQYRVMLIIDPQPDWEWIRITNVGEEPMHIHDVYYKTHCGDVALPEPGTIALVCFGLVGLAGAVRRKLR